MGKKTIIISNYYLPEIGAAANRIKNLAESLQQNGKEVVVFCPLPNYPKGQIFKQYKGKFSTTEVINKITVKRFWLYPSNSKNSAIRIFSMLSFAITLWTSIFYIFKNKIEVIIIQSPPLFVAFSGILLSKLTRIKNVLNVSDLWPLSALELGVIKKGTFYDILLKIEKFNYKNADKITVQSNEIKEYIYNISERNSFLYRNVPFYKSYAAKTKDNSSLKIVYAGLLGYAQNILAICQQIDFNKIGVEFHIYGNGMEKEAIEKIAIIENNNIFFHGSVPASEIKEKIRLYDVALVLLKNRIQGAVPSKIFELVQLGIPMIYNSYGEAKDIILEHNIGLVSEPNDFKSLKNKIIAFKSFSSEKYETISKNCLKLHLEKFRLDYQLEETINYIYEKN